MFPFGSVHLCSFCVVCLSVCLNFRYCYCRAGYVPQSAHEITGQLCGIDSLLLYVSSGIRTHVTRLAHRLVTC